MPCESDGKSLGGCSRTRCYRNSYATYRSSYGFTSRSIYLAASFGRARRDVLLFTSGFARSFHTADTANTHCPEAPLYVSPCSAYSDSLSHTQPSTSQHYTIAIQLTWPPLCPLPTSIPRGTPHPGRALLGYPWSLQRRYSQEQVEASEPLQLRECLRHQLLYFCMPLLLLYESILHKLLGLCLRRGHLTHEQGSLWR